MFPPFSVNFILAGLEVFLSDLAMLLRKEGLQEKVLILKKYFSKDITKTFKDHKKKELVYDQPMYTLAGSVPLGVCIRRMCHQA